MKAIYSIIIVLLFLKPLSAISVEKTVNGLESMSFYSVPLVCGAAPEIGCGSRLKPLFLDFSTINHVKEVWSNRQGTVVAIVWNDPIPAKKKRQEIVKPIFERNTVDAQLISSQTKIAELNTSFYGGDKWYRGTDVDMLSIEEAGIIAESLTSFAFEEGIINTEESSAIKGDLEDYFKNELTQVRTFENLKSESTQERWRQHGYQIYVDHIGTERAQKVSELYHALENQELEVKMNSKSCCSKKANKDCCKKQ